MTTLARRFAFSAVVLLSMAVADAAPAANTYVAKVLYPTTSFRSTTIGSDGRTLGDVTTYDFALQRSVGHAVLAGPQGRVDLHPAGFTASRSFASSGNIQVGQAYTAADVPHAIVWNGTRASAVDITPPGFLVTFARGVSGTSTVGFGYQTVNAADPSSGYARPLYWPTIAPVAIDLTPAAFTHAVALANDATRQVGYGSGAVTNSQHHALAWAGSAQSVVDLHPANFNSSVAQAVSGSQIVGYGTVPNGTGYHAVLWSTPDGGDAIDLHSAQFSSTLALATNGTQQVGYGTVGAGLHAVVWSSSAESLVDLNALLPSGYAYSRAESIDAAGNVYGFASGATSALPTIAVVWQVPEPMGLGVFLLAGTFFAVRRRSCLA